MSSEFNAVYHHRLRYFLTPQFDIYRNIRRFVASKEPDWAIDEFLSVLDYGCGNGVGSLLLKHDGWEIVGIDSDEEAIAFAADSWGHLVEFKHEDWTARSHLESSDAARYQRRYDVVVCLEVIEHVADPLLLLQSLQNACKTKANVFISTLNHNSQYRKNRGHVGKFHVQDFRFLVEKVFGDVRIFNYDFSEELSDDSTLTPMLAICQGG